MTPLLTLDAAGSVAPGFRQRGRGQPTRYTEVLRAAICRDIAQGVPVSKAFLCNGISPRTGFNWALQRPDFASAVQAARVQYNGRKG